MMELNRNFKQVTVVGVGLLGGSIGLALRAGGFAGRLVGVGRRQSSLDEAMTYGTVDAVTLDAAEGVAEADLVILATPVGGFAPILKRIKPALKPRAIVTDVGSTKQLVVRTAEKVLGRGGPFVGSHPMAGSEMRGPAYARADLFVGATCILTPTSHTPPVKVDRVEWLWKVLGMRTLRMSPAAHDKAVARVSHLPHVVAGLLTLLPGETDFDVAATGFRDATRMASGSPEMWRDILVTNRKAIGQAIAALGKDLEAFADLLENGDDRAVERFFAKAKTRRDTTIGARFTDRRLAME